MKKKLILRVIAPLLATSSVIGSGYAFFYFNTSSLSTENRVNYKLTAVGNLDNHSSSVSGAINLTKSGITGPSETYTEYVSFIFGKNAIYDGNKYNYGYLPIQYYFEYTINYSLNAKLSSYFYSAGVKVSVNNIEYNVDWDSSSTSNGVITYHLVYDTTPIVVTPNEDWYAESKLVCGFTPLLDLNHQNSEFKYFPISNDAQLNKLKKLIANGRASFSSSAAWACEDVD
jgi:hypothetical protein